MWSVFVLVYLLVFRVDAQKGPSGRPYDNGHGWDIRYAVPGEPEKDYPTLREIPRTSFTCSKKEPGYYADVETNCQVFRICTLGSTYGFQSFLCPNGTLFNQAVFVCDWWMNVNCKKSPEYFNSNEKHSKLRVGPELMTDVKMMLTHPMRNPYDKTGLNNKLVVSQEYIPPYRIINANGNRITENERNIDNFYIQSKPANIRKEQYTNDLSFAASTGTPFYSQNTNNFQRNTPRQFATFENIVAHPTSAQITYNPNVDKQRLVSQNQQKLLQQKQQYLNTNEYRFFTGNTNNEIQYLRKPSQLRSENLIKQPNSNNFQVQKQVFGSKITKDNPTFNRNILQNTVTKQNQNIVSNNIPPTLITKTLTYRKIIPNPQKGQPKSRIVFKTWILKPSRNARLVADPTPYTYNSPITSANLIADPTPYIYNAPVTSAKLVAGPTPYTYNAPITSANLVSDGSYNYDKPNLSFSGKIQGNNAITSIAPTVSNKLRENSVPTTRTTISDRLYLPPLTAAPTKASIVYLPPTTYKPASILYLPPATSAKLRVQQNYESPTSVAQQPDLNSETETLPFSDILTKEKLDITVKDIVENTNKIINNQPPQQNNLLVKQNIQINNEPPVDFYLPAQMNQDSEEKVTSLSQVELPKSSRLVALPSTDLEPPNENINDDSENSISMLPFINESNLPENTIERTVSLKITIPEKVANFIFKNRKTSNTDDLEILNTGSSNYLVLNSKDSDSFVPLGKLTLNKNSNHSSSQDLVYSIIADSINAAKQYSNIAQQETSSTQSTITQEQKKDNTEVEQFSDKVSQLTSSQYSPNTNTKTNQRQQTQLQQLRSNEQVSRQNDESGIFNQKNILSGQLYQLPVPVVTKQIYNAPLKNAWTQARQNLVESRNGPKTNYFLQQIKSPQKAVSENLELQATGRNEEDEKTLDNAFESEFIKHIKDSNNRISARIHDKTVGTITHPSEDNKQITYNKDKTYYVYTQLKNNEEANTVPLKQAHVHQDELNLHHVTHLSSKLSTNEDTYNNNQIRNNYVAAEQDDFERYDQRSKARLESTSNVDYEVEHRLPQGVQRNNVQKLSRLYDGPSSYSAPQNSIGNLQDIGGTNSNYNSRLEDLENNNNNIDSNNNFNGYSRDRPAKRFLF